MKRRLLPVVFAALFLLLPLWWVYRAPTHPANTPSSRMDAEAHTAIPSPTSASSSLPLPGSASSHSLPITSRTAQSPRADNWGAIATLDEHTLTDTGGPLYLRERLLQTSFKYPYLLVQQWLEPSSGRVLSETARVADSTEHVSSDSAPRRQAGLPV